MESDSSSSEWKEKDYTLIFCRRTNDAGEREVLLGMKKRGFGAGKWNGFGGKLEGSETIEQGAVRELEEESGLQGKSLVRIGYLTFKMLELSKIMRVHVYETWEFDGSPVESEEMRPQWFLETKIPFSSMWPDDEHWFPYFLAGKKFIGRFEYEDDDTITDFTVSEHR